MTIQSYTAFVGEGHKTFECPDDVARDRKLSHDEKVAILKDWELDLQRLLSASEERMLSPGSGHAPEMLREVQDSLRALDDGGAGAKPAKKRSRGPRK